MPSFALPKLSLKGVPGTIFAIALLALCALIASYLEPAPEPLSGRVVASDGDSFHYGAERIRLLGIDAPELEQTCDKDGASWPCGRQAKERLAHLLLGRIACARDGRDRFGRALAKCTSDGKDIGAIMVSTGWAIATEDYDREQSAARSSHLGIWAGSFETPRTWRDQNPRSGY